MGPIGCSETSARNYHFTLHKIPKECRFHLHRGGILESFFSVTCPPRLSLKSRRPFETVDWSAVTRSDLTVLLKFRATPWLKRLVADLSPYRPSFTAKPVHMIFVVDRVAFGQVPLPVLQFSFFTVIPSLLHTCNLFPNHRRCTTSVIDSVIT